MLIIIIHCFEGQGQGEQRDHGLLQEVRSRLRQRCCHVRVHQLPVSANAGKTPLKKAIGENLALYQVWSLTQFYSVDFSNSRIGEKKCVFDKRTIKVCISCC